jgi:zinc protease
MKFLSICVLILACSAPAWAKAVKVQETPLPNGLKVEEYRLSNGLQLLLVPDHSAPVITYQVWIKAGSATEKLDPRLKRTGLAHLFEHMMFRGTPKNPDQVFDQKMSAAGAVDENASTYFHRTSFHESLPKNKLPLAFELESDRMAHLALDEKLFKTELGAVFGEKKMREDRPGLVAYEKLWDLAFEQSPYKWNTMGTTEELNSFTVADAQYFYKTYYAPNNAAVIVLGDFSVPEALKLAEKYYGKMKAQKIPDHPLPVEPPQEKAKELRITHPLATSDIVMLGYKTPAMTSPDMPVLNVAAAVLAYGDGSWLEQEMVQTGLASSVSADPSETRYPSLFTVSAQLAPGKSADDALQVIHGAVDRLRDGKISPEELERAKNQYLLFSYTDLLKLSNIGETLGEALASSGNYLRDFEILGQVKTVTVADVQRVARKYFTDTGSSTLILTPPQKGKQQ